MKICKHAMENMPNRLPKNVFFSRLWDLMCKLSRERVKNAVENREFGLELQK